LVATRPVTESIITFISFVKRSFTTGITSSIVVQVSIQRTRELAVIHAVSVDGQERIVTARNTSTVPIEIPASRAGIIAEISVPLISIFMGQGTVFVTSVIEVQRFIGRALVATEVLVTRCNKI